MYEMVFCLNSCIILEQFGRAGDAKGHGARPFSVAFAGTGAGGLK